MDYDFKGRISGLQQRMRELDIDLVIYGSCPNFQYLTGLLIDWRHWVDLGSWANGVFVPKEGEPILTLSQDYADNAEKSWIKDVRLLDANHSFDKILKQIISDLDFRPRNVGIDNHAWASTITGINEALNRPVLYNSEHLMDKLRMIKDSEEILKLRKVAELTDKAVEQLMPYIKRGTTQAELRIELEHKAKQLGASDTSFPPWIGFVKSGSRRTKTLVTYPIDEGLEPNTSVAFDCGFVLDGYCSDFGRSFYFGNASEEVKRAYRTLQNSVVEVVSTMKLNEMRVCDVYPAIEKELDDRGFGDYLRARLSTRSVGHNIGIEVHEPPWLDPRYEEELQPNMVIAIEPKLWHSGEYYLRVEDILLIGPKKAEFLTKFDRELFLLN